MRTLRNVLQERQERQPRQAQPTSLYDILNNAICRVAATAGEPDLNAEFQGDIQKFLAAAEQLRRYC